MIAIQTGIARILYHNGISKNAIELPLKLVRIYVLNKNIKIDNAIFKVITS